MQLPLNQKVTYWAPMGSDDFGGTAFSEPTVRRARWEDKAQLIQNKAGAEYTSRSRVYMDGDFDLNGYLYLGESDEAIPTNQAGAYEIQQKASVPDLKAVQTNYVAYL